MNRVISVAVIVILALWLLPSAGYGQSGSTQQPRESDFRERYGVIAERNIFMRNRSRPSQNRVPTTRASTGGSSQPRRPEQSYTLTGIVLEEGRQVAFIENATTKTTERLTVGAAVARGKIVGMGYDYLEYEAGGQRVRVQIGSTLAGDGTGAAAVVAEGPSTQPSSGGAAATIDPDNPNLSVEERMRLRRLQGK